MYYNPTGGDGGSPSAAREIQATEAKVMKEIKVKSVVSSSTNSVTENI